MRPPFKAVTQPQNVDLPEQQSSRCLWLLKPGAREVEGRVRVRKRDPAGRRRAIPVPGSDSR